MLKHFVLLLFILFRIQLSAQVIPSYLADWKNDASGAYSIIHDDYGDVGVDGIWQYADTIAFNRGLRFTFGAISASCEVSRTVNGQASPYLYAKNVMMGLHFHEIISHSHTHTCALNRGWSPCGTAGWGEVVGSADWTMQLYNSHNSILTNTGHQPRYFIFPYDQFTDAANTELASMGYLGSRTGWHISGAHNPFYKYGYEANDENMFLPNANGFFRTSVQVFDDVNAGQSDGAQTAELNSVVDAAIANNQWGNRELHNVGALGWGHVTVNAYRNHLNYTKAKVTSGELWMGTVSELLTYQIQKLVYSATSAVYNSGTQKITVSFTQDNSVVTKNIATHLSGLTIKTPVTIVLDLNSYTSLLNFNNISVKQGADIVTDVVYKNNKLFVNVYPHKGSFTIEENIALPISIIPKPTKPILPPESFVLYPNPATTTLSINNEEVRQMEVYSLDGIKIMEVEGNQADVSSLPAGFYFVSIKEFGIWQRFIKR